MNRAELIAAVVSETGLSKRQAEGALTATIKTVKNSVRKGDDVKLIGLGTFTKAKRKARIGRNPQTGKSIKLPACGYPKFRAGAEFKALVR